MFSHNSNFSFKTNIPQVFFIKSHPKTKKRRRKKPKFKMEAKKISENILSLSTKKDKQICHSHRVRDLLGLI